MTWPTRVLATAVFIWHMYPPLSDSWMLLICKFHVWCWSWDTLIRGLRVMTRFWTVRIADLSKWIHATCIMQIPKQLIPHSSLLQRWINYNSNSFLQCLRNSYWKISESQRETQRNSLKFKVSLKVSIVTPQRNPGISFLRDWLHK